MCPLQGRKNMSSVRNPRQHWRRRILKITTEVAQDQGPVPSPCTHILGKHYIFYKQFALNREKRNDVTTAYLLKTVSLHLRIMVRVVKIFLMFFFFFNVKRLKWNLFHVAQANHHFFYERWKTFDQGGFYLDTGRGIKIVYW